MQVRSSLSALVAVAVLAFPGVARADVSSWLFAGAGPSFLERKGRSTDTATSMQLDAGVGLPPSYAVVVGGLFRMHTRFGDGSDFGAFLRTATGGYARGNWGAALDLGGYVRPWGDEQPGLAGTLSLGGPWGVTLNLDAAQGPDQVRAFAVVLGLDFARFTVHRHSGLGWWDNPFPSPRDTR